MNYEDERYARLYTRDTVTWKRWDWRARLVFMLMLRKVDRSGVLDVGDDGVDGLAVALEIPTDICEAGVAQLEERGTLRRAPAAFVLPNFMHAQECRQSDKVRQQTSRERRRLDTLEASPGVTSRHPLSQMSPAVTDRHSVPSRTVLFEARDVGADHARPKRKARRALAGARGARVRAPHPRQLDGQRLASKLIDALVRNNPTHKIAKSNRDGVAAGWAPHMCELLDRDVTVAQIEDDIAFALGHHFLRKLVHSAKTFVAHYDRVVTERTTNGRSNGGTLHEAALRAVREEEARLAARMPWEIDDDAT